MPKTSSLTIVRIVTSNAVPPSSFGGAPYRFFNRFRHNFNCVLVFSRERQGQLLTKCKIPMLARFLEYLAQLFEKPPVQTVAPVVAAAVTAVEPAAPPLPPPVDMTQFQGLVGRVSELTTSVAQDVGQHNKSIQAISSELTTVAQTDPSSVAAIV